ncbi:hypothetical protein BKA63DRAFT_313238 [Paraphoma chrysanthemicola]|nr:hypothetical protein BKA63DRAFT_313238 [Paraphoma chrysanthemicola]
MHIDIAAQPYGEPRTTLRRDDLGHSKQQIHWELETIRACLPMGSLTCSIRCHYECPMRCSLGARLEWTNPHTFVHLRPAQCSHCLSVHTTGASSRLRPVQGYLDPQCPHPRAHAHGPPSPAAAIPGQHSLKPSCRATFVACPIAIWLHAKATFPVHSAASVLVSISESLLVPKSLLDSRSLSWSIRGMLQGAYYLAKHM